MKYTGIAESADMLAEILRENMVPGVVSDREKIMLCNPADRGDCRVGIWLYDIRECDELRSHSMVTLDAVRQKYPPSFVNLMFMITAYAGGDLPYRAKEEQCILGKILQVLKDHTTVEGTAQLPCSIELQNLSMEEKMRIFNVPQRGYQTSLFYEMGPIEIESEKERQVTRVTEQQFRLREQKGAKWRNR